MMGRRRMKSAVALRDQKPHDFEIQTSAQINLLRPMLTLVAKSFAQL